MAARSRARKAKKQPNTAQQIWAVASRPHVIGSVLILISVFTLLSLVTGSRGQVTGVWIDSLEMLIGVGVWGLPLVTCALGLWTVIRAIERMDNLAWQRPVGLGLLLLALIIGATLLVPRELRPAVAEQGEAGGLLGLALANVLEDALSRWGAWSFVTFLTVSGIIFLSDRYLIDMGLQLWYAVSDWWQQRSLVVYPPDINPNVPLPSGHIPLWKRMIEGLPGRNEGTPHPLPPNLVMPDPKTGGSASRVPSAAQTPSSPSAKEDGAPNPERPPVSQPRKEDGLLTPRIVGGSGQVFRLPKISDILQDWERHVDGDQRIREQGRLIQETLANFGVPADFEGAYKGPAVTQYLIKPGYVERTVRGEVRKTKIKVSKIASLSNDLALALAAPSVRIEAPIPGTSYVGVEVPNLEGNIVGLKELMESEPYEKLRAKGNLPIALGEDVKGQSIVSDLTRMPHLLIAGATGSGKSACINSVITCLLLTQTPDSLRFLMVDPKMVELSVYNGIPHLLSPVVTEVDKAAGVLFWAVKEMERRYQLLSKANARDLVRYNAYLQKRDEKPLPYIVVIVDEMADLMMAAPEEVEKHICRLAQMARAIGIHLVIATQRPSVDVITGLIKANFPARISFAVTSQIDSRVILDIPGAERLLGKGDMLFMAPDTSRLERLQGSWVGDEEINNIVRYWKGVRTLSDTYAQGELFGDDINDYPISAHDAAQRELRKTPFDDGSFSAVPVRGLRDSADQQVVDEAPSVQGSTTRPSLSEARSAHLRTRQTTGPQSVSYGAPPEQPPLFEEMGEMHATDARDELLEEAARVVCEAGKGSVSLLQRKLRIGYNRASRLVDELEEMGILGPDQGSSIGRPVLIPHRADDSSMPAPRIIGAADSESEPDRSQFWF